MAAFPPAELEIYGKDEFLGFSIESADPNLGVSVLAQITDTGHITEHFRLVFSGNVYMTNMFAANQLFDFPEATGIKLHYQIAPQDLTLEFNRTTTRLVFVCYATVPFFLPRSVG